MPTRKLSSIAAALGLILQGEDKEVSGVSTIEAAGPTELTFLSNPKYAALLASTKAGAVILHPDHAAQASCALLSENPYQDFGRALALFAKPQGHFVGQSPLAFVHPEAVVHESATVYPFAYVGARARVEEGVTLYPGVYLGEDCSVGAHTVIYPNASLMAGTVVGSHCILHAGLVLGADGFGFARTPAGIQKIPQAGTVQIGNHVEIGANTAIDRAVLDVTRVGDGTKIDNLVQLGHNVQVGKNTFLVAHVGISGSTKIGDNCTIAGQVGVAGHLTVGNNVTVGPQSGVAKDIPDNQIMGGTPAVDQGTFMRTLTLMPRFPELFKRLAKVEKMLEQLSREPLSK